MQQRRALLLLLLPILAPAASQTEEAAPERPAICTWPRRRQTAVQRAGLLESPVPDGGGLRGAGGKHQTSDRDRHQSNVVGARRRDDRRAGRPRLPRSLANPRGRGCPRGPARRGGLAHGGGHPGARPPLPHTRSAWGHDSVPGWRADCRCVAAAPPPPPLPPPLLPPCCMLPLAQPPPLRLCLAPRRAAPLRPPRPSHHSPRALLPACKSWARPEPERQQCLTSSLASRPSGRQG